MPSRKDSKYEATRRKVLGAMGAGAAVSVAGCGIFDDESDPGEFTGTLGAEPDDFDPTTIDDASTNSAYGTMCYETLVDNDFELAEVEPALATDWEQVSADPTVFEFDLREDVEFHNGDEFVAEDVRFSIERMRGTVNGAEVAPIEEVEVIDDSTVEISWSLEHAPALNNLAAVPILPHDHDDISEEPAEDDFDFEEESIGTGPWELDDYSVEDRVVLAPFEDYWHDDENPWDEVTLRIVPEQTSQEEALANREVDMIDNAAPFDLDQWDDEDDLEPIVDDAVGFDFVSFPVTTEPFSNQKFRRGVARLIPRDDIVEAIFGGFATPLGAPISPGLGAFFDEDYNQDLLDEYVGEDPAEGEQLLEEGLEELGMLDEAPIEVEFITNVNRTRERWMEEIQATMDETEYIDANLDIRDFDALVDFLLDPEGAAASTDVVGIGWTGGSDPNGHIEQLNSSAFHVPNGFNWNLYENEEVDDLISQGQTTLDVDDRRDVYHELGEVLAEDVPDAYMWTGDQIDVVDTSTVDGWQPYPNASFRYWALYRPNVGVVAEPA